MSDGMGWGGVVVKHEDLIDRFDLKKDGVTLWDMMCVGT